MRMGRLKLLIFGHLIKDVDAQYLQDFVHGWRQHIEERRHLPSLLIELCDLKCSEVEVVCQKDEHSIRESAKSA